MPGELSQKLAKTILVHTSMDGNIDPNMTRLVLDNVLKECNDSELKKQVQ